MRNPKALILALGILTALAPVYSWAQTSIGEVETSLKMNEELNNIGAGPGPGAVRSPGPVPAPGPGVVRPPSPGPSVARPPSSVPGAGPASAGTSAPVARPVGPARVVKAPEGGFEPTRAAQKANLGFELMHDMRFDEAVDAYRQAMELDSERYGPAYQGMLQAVTQIKQFGVDTVGQVVMSEQPVKVTVAEYFGWR